MDLGTSNTPEFIVTLIDSDSIQPREKRPTNIELGERKIDLYEDFLDNVFNIMAVADVMVDKVEEGLLIPSYQLFEGNLITFAAKVNKLAVVFWV